MALSVDSKYYMPLYETDTGYMFIHVDGANAAVSWYELLKDGTGGAGGSISILHEPASATTLGGIKVGTGLVINDGVLSIDTSYITSLVNT